MIIIPRLNSSVFKKYLDDIAFSLVQDITDTTYRSSPCCRAYFVTLSDKSTHEFEINWQLSDDKLVESFKKFILSLHELLRTTATEKPVRRRFKKATS